MAKVSITYTNSTWEGYDLYHEDFENEAKALAFVANRTVGRNPSVSIIKLIVHPEVQEALTFEEVANMILDYGILNRETSNIKSQTFAYELYETEGTVKFRNREFNFVEKDSTPAEHGDAWLVFEVDGKTYKLTGKHSGRHEPSWKMRKLEEVTKQEKVISSWN